jgi:hypothetical protein
LENVQLTPTIANINAQLLPLLELYERYRFFYLDIMEVMRAYPNIAERHREHIANQIRYIRAIIDYSVGSGNMLPESKPAQYDSLAETVCLMLTFWLSHHTVRGKEGSFFNDAREAMWALVVPLLTEKGRQAFEGVLKGVSPPGLEPGIRSLVRAPGQRASCKRYKLEISVTVIVVLIHFQNLYIPPRPMYFKKEGGPSAGSSFEQNRA